MPPLKILYYNWTDYHDAERRGGGVSVYQKNLIDAAARRGDEAWFFSAGTSYSPFSRTPFIRELRRRDSARRFELVNSAVMSPGHAAFGQDVRSEPAMEQVFSEFLRRHGPFDVVHFNNLEGIPVSFLGLARAHAADAKVVFSLHNYFAFCPQVNLWFQERQACTDYRDGRKCVNCLVSPRPSGRLAWRYRFDYCLSKVGLSPHAGPGWVVRQVLFGSARLAGRGLAAGVRAFAGRAPGLPPTWGEPEGRALVLLDSAGAAGFAARRRHFVEAINNYVDRVVAVSRRAAEIAVGHGVAAEKVRTLYIGTRFGGQTAGLLTRPAVRTTAGGPSLCLAYLGYARRDKGFFFYLKALARMPERLTRRLRLVFATKLADERSYLRLRRMAHRFAGVTIYNGYAHAQLPEILAGVDLGVVPVLWEDNLPQVAIECVGSGVPVLTSDRGGARELLSYPDLVFKAGSVEDLLARIEAVLRDPGILRRAMAHRRRLLSPDEHYEQLRSEIYFGREPVDPESIGPRGRTEPAEVLRKGLAVLPEQGAV